MGFVIPDLVCCCRGSFWTGPNFGKEKGKICGKKYVKFKDEILCFFVMAAIVRVEEVNDYVIVEVVNENEKKFSCKVCKKSYKTFGNAKRHVVIKHCEVGLIECCDEKCGESFGTTDLMRDHCIQVHGEGQRICPSPGCDISPKAYTR
jgi:hypothetical protein